MTRLRTIEGEFIYNVNDLETSRFKEIKDDSLNIPLSDDKLSIVHGTFVVNGTFIISGDFKIVEID